MGIIEENKIKDALKNDGKARYGVNAEDEKNRFKDWNN